MQRQEYPDKAQFQRWNLVCNGGNDIEKQFSDWHKEHENFVVTQHSYECVNGIESLNITYFDLDIVEKDVDTEFRTPRNEFYFKKIVEDLESGHSDKFSDWYDNNDIDIISASTKIDADNLKLVSGYVYVNRDEAKAAYDLKYERQQKQIQKMSEELAKKQIVKESSKKN